LPIPRYRRDGHLRLGWRVTSEGHPHYWLDKQARPGKQKKDELVMVPVSSMGTHTVIVAQSGSGKSLFLGRLIEELILCTRARCLILDPNADFRRIHEVEGSELWTTARYNARAGTGKLPDEGSQRDFATRWSNVKVRIRTQRSDYLEGPSAERIQVWWPSLSSEFLAEGLNPLLRSELYHAHVFLRVVGNLVRAEKRYLGKKAPRRRSIITTAETLYGKIHHLRENQDFSKIVHSAFEEEFEELSERGTGRDREVFPRFAFRRQTERAAAAIRYVSEAMERFYFAKAHEYEASGIVAGEPPSGPPNRIDVLDLPSLPERDTRHLVVNATLATEFTNALNAWASALYTPPEKDTRVPTFIIADEAHNLVPAQPTGRAEGAIREQFRTIAAEGRKYGLFLILASQRPDKLDPLILSECENKAVMRLDSKSLLDKVRLALGLEDVRPDIVDRCRQFGIGRVLIAGRWSPEPQILYSAARRTKEGGRNLNPRHWAVPMTNSRS